MRVPVGENTSRGRSGLLRFLEIMQHEIAIAVLPFFAISVAAEPTFALKEMKKNDATKQPLHEIAQRFAGAIKFILIVTRGCDAENLLGCNCVIDQIFHEYFVVMLVCGEEFFV